MKQADRTFSGEPTAGAFVAQPSPKPLGMKICVTGLRGLPGVMGGVESHCEQLLPRLHAIRPQDDIDVLVRKPYTRPRAYTFAGMRVIPLRAIKNKHLEAASNTIIAILYARFVAKADLICIHAIGPALFIPLARLLGMKVLLTHHGKDYERQRWSSLSKLALRLGEWLGVNNAHRVISVSPSLAEDLRERFPHRVNNIHYIPNGATVLPSSTEAEADRVLAELGLTKGEYIVAAGRLVPEKGFDDLVDAFEALESDKKLIIAGRADNEDAYSQQLTARAGIRVLFPGYKDPATLRVLYENASLFVLPSYHEGLPIAVLEAIECGAPVLLSQIDANLDVGLPSRNYFPLGDVGALTQKLHEDHEVYRADYSSVLSRLDWDVAAASTAVLLEEVENMPPRHFWDRWGRSPSK